MTLGIGYPYPTQVLFGEGLSGALYIGDFARLLSSLGLPAWGVTHCRKISVNSEKIQRQVGDIEYYSATVRVVKLNSSQNEEAPENYGQVRGQEQTCSLHHYLQGLIHSLLFWLDCNLCGRGIWTCREVQAGPEPNISQRSVHGSGLHHGCHAVILSLQNGFQLNRKAGAQGGFYQLAWTSVQHLGYNP